MVDYIPTEREMSMAQAFVFKVESYRAFRWLPNFAFLVILWTVIFRSDRLKSWTWSKLCFTDGSILIWYPGSDDMRAMPNFDSSD